MLPSPPGLPRVDQSKPPLPQPPMAAAAATAESMPAVGKPTLPSATTIALQPTGNGLVVGEYCQVMYTLYQDRRIQPIYLYRQIDNEYKTWRYVFPYHMSTADMELASHSACDVLKHTKAWVTAMVSAQGLSLCPLSADLMPAAELFVISQSTSLRRVYMDWWQAVKQFAESSLQPALLVVFPQFTADYIRFNIFACDIISSFQSATHAVQPALFHPEHVFRSSVSPHLQDAWLLYESAAFQFSRRSPYPMIKLLKSEVLQQEMCKHGKEHSLAMLQRNRDCLEGIGMDKLQSMLQAKNWDEILLPAGSSKANEREGCQGKEH